MPSGSSVFVASWRLTPASSAHESAVWSRRSPSLLQEVPDLVEYPSVVAGHIPVEFLKLPEEVLTTTMIHHQHYFPVVDEEGRLKPAFLAVTNMQAERPEIIARNSERVLTARLRDARFFWDEDRKATLESRIGRLSTILFHKKLGSYREKADRIAALAAWIAEEAFGRPDAAARAEQAARLCKADLATDMVRELTELQGTMGGIYAREEGMPEDVWKAIYYHYLPVGVEADAPPSRQQLGAAAVTWAAVSLADKLDSVVGMFWAGERPTGSRDPLGLRRQAQGAVKILVDLPDLAGLENRLPLGRLLAQAALPFGGYGDSEAALLSFMGDRLSYLARAARLRRPQRARCHARRAGGHQPARGAAQARRAGADVRFRIVTRCCYAAQTREEHLEGCRGAGDPRCGAADRTRGARRSCRRSRPAQTTSGLRPRAVTIAMRSPASLRSSPPVSKFFDDVLVMADDERLRAARLGLVASLRGLILDIADISEIVTD